MGADISKERERERGSQYGLVVGSGGEKRGAPTPFGSHSRGM